MWRCAVSVVAGAIAMAGCGRLALDTPGTTDAPSGSLIDAGPVSLADTMPCGMPVSLADNVSFSHDVMAWVNDSEGDWLVAVQHEDQDKHHIHRFPIVASGSSIAAQNGSITASTDPRIDILDVDHVDVLSFEPIAAGNFVLGYTEFVLGTAQTLQLTPGMVQMAAHPLGALSAGNPPLARAGGGGMAMIGLTNGLVEAVPLDDTGTPIASAGPSFLTQSPAVNPAHPTMIALDTGLAAVWDTSGSSGCQLAVLRADLSIAAGPITIGPTNCTDPHLAWLPTSGRILVIAGDGGSTNVLAGAFTTDLTPVTAMSVVATNDNVHWSRILGDGDGAWISWVDTSNGQRVASGRLTDTARLASSYPIVGSLDGALGHFQWMWRAGTQPVVLWVNLDATGTDRSFTALRLCP